MRVTGGRFTGRQLVSPKGARIRSTLDHVRQALFNQLGERILGACLLELFCGSGAVGIEALSRGAAHVTFVDRSHFCIQAVRKNLEQLALTGLHRSPFTLFRADALEAIRRLHQKGRKFDLLFLDPPYGEDWAIKSLNRLSRYAIVSPNGLVMVEHDKRDLLPAQVEGEESRLSRQGVKRYGDTALTFYGAG